MIPTSTALAEKFLAGAAVEYAATFGEDYTSYTEMHSRIGFWRRRLGSIFFGLAHILGQFSAKEETASVASIASARGLPAMASAMDATDAVSSLAENWPKM